MVNAELIAVGSEMLNTQRVDTNSLFLADQLNALGVEVVRKQIVGDDRALLSSAVRDALSHASVVMLTGGLGPTEDDVTREAVAAALGRELIFHQDICDDIEQRFRRRGRKMAEINRRQAFVIQGAEVLANSKGTAPGLWIEQGDQLVVLLPGPPPEMRAVFGECWPRLQRRVPEVFIRSRFYRVTGMTESDLDALIAPAYKSYTNPATTVLASAGDIQVLLRSRCSTATEAERLLQEVGSLIEELLGPRLYSRNGDALEAVIGALLRERGETLCVAESCTGGMLSQRITSLAGSSDYFVGGFLTYTGRMKTELLGVDPHILEQHTAVSEETAVAMAEGARTRTGATYAVSITGEAGPQSSTGAPVGTIYIGLAASGSAAEARRYVMPGDRERVRGFAVNAALDQLRRRILGLG